MAAGGFAGCVSKTVTAPLARLTILYQARASSGCGAAAGGWRLAGLLQPTLGGASLLARALTQGPQVQTTDVVPGWSGRRSLSVAEALSRVARTEGVAVRRPPSPQPGPQTFPRRFGKGTGRP